MLLVGQQQRHPVLPECLLFGTEKKRCQKQSMNMQKIQRETLLEDASAMIFIDFGLLRSSYLLKSADVTQVW